MNETMGQIIRRLRREHSLTQEAFAEQLNVSPQAVSKWESGASMPDISQVVPLARLLGVTTDVLFGLDKAPCANDEVRQILQEADSMKVYGESESYFRSYELLLRGLERHPNHLPLIYNCMRLGLNLCLPENGWLYAAERAADIARETVRQAKYVIAYSSDVSMIMEAHLALVFVYLSQGEPGKAAEEARFFPVRSDFTLYSTMAMVDHAAGNNAREVTCLCSDIVYKLQALEDDMARLGQAYLKLGKSNDAIRVYEAFFSVMKAVSGEDIPQPYHDFDSGDCYILLAEAYLAAGDREGALRSAEDAVNYWLTLTVEEGGEYCLLPVTTPVLRESEVLIKQIPREILKIQLMEKLSCDRISPLHEEERFQMLLQAVRELP